MFIPSSRNLLELHLGLGGYDKNLWTGGEGMKKVQMTYTMVADRKSDGNLAETANLPHMCLGCSLLLDETERKWVNSY